MKRKLIFLDIDGTLTPAGSNTPPESAMTAIRKAQENGHLVFLCTGRNPAMLAPVLTLGFEGAVAAAGGEIDLHLKVAHRRSSAAVIAAPDSGRELPRSKTKKIPPVRLKNSRIAV